MLICSLIDMTTGQHIINLPMPVPPSRGDVIALNGPGGSNTERFDVIQVRFVYTKSQVIGEIEQQFGVHVIVNPVKATPPKKKVARAH